MINLINSIIDRDFIEADFILEESVQVIMSRKLEEAKKMYAAKMAEQSHSMNRTASKLVRLGVVEEDNIEEMSGNSGLVVNKKPESASGKTDLGGPAPSNSKSISDTETDDLIKRNTEGLKRAKQRGMLPPGHPITTRMEEETLEEARINIIKARIRGGKIQRRKKVSNVPGMTLRGGKLQRMSAAERRRRKLGARKAVRKRMPKMNRALMKRKRSLIKRRALGL
jgi:hypothetical protein